MTIEQYDDRYINKNIFHQNYAVKKKGNVDEKCNLNKVINITKIHKQNNAKNKHVFIIINLLCKHSKQTLEAVTHNPRTVHAHAARLKCKCGGVKFNFQAMP